MPLTMLSTRPSASVVGLPPRGHTFARNDDAFDPDEILLGRRADHVEETAEESEDATDARLFEWDALALDMFREADRYLD